MSTCENCGHHFFWVKNREDERWRPFETVPNAAAVSVAVESSDGLVLDYLQPIRMHQCQREWVREWMARLDRDCPSCGVPPGVFCVALSGAYPRPNLKSLMHESRQP